MKVLMNAVSARRGGIATYTRNIIRTLPREGIDAKIAVPPGLASVDRSATLGLEVGDLGQIRRLFWDQVVWRRLVYDVDPDVLFSSANFGLLRCSTPQLLLMREGGLFNPYYLEHVFPSFPAATRALHRQRRSLMRMSIRNADLVMFPSETLRDWVARFEPSVMDRAIVNNYGIALDRFKHRPPTTIDEKDDLRLTYVSVYYPHKNPITLARSVTILRAQGYKATARITMGRNDFDPWPGHVAELRDMEEHASREEIVLGPVESSQLPDLLFETDVFVFPSLSETFGFPLVEAMASGVPVVAADTLINREICGPAALYYSPEDPQALAEQIRRLVARPDLYLWLRIEGLKRATERYSWNAHLSRLIVALNQTITRHNQLKETRRV